MNCSYICTPVILAYSFTAHTVLYIIYTLTYVPITDFIIYKYWFISPLIVLALRMLHCITVQTFAAKQLWRSVFFCLNLFSQKKITCIFMLKPCIKMLLSISPTILLPINSQREKQLCFSKNATDKNKFFSQHFHLVTLSGRILPELSGVWILRI
jgi:hypothetical protein